MIVKKEKDVVTTKKQITEVKDLQGYITKRTLCCVMAMIIAFIVNYVPVMVLNAKLIIVIMLYILFWFYAYCICLLIYTIITPSSRNIRASDIDGLLINKGYEISPKKVHYITINPFKKTIKYRTKSKAGNSITFVFYIKLNKIMSVTKAFLKGQTKC